MEAKLLGRIGAIAFVAIAITVAVVEATRPPAPTAPAPVAREAPPSVDPLRQALSRCQALGAAAAEDRQCLDAWAENRRRFFSVGGAEEGRADAAPADPPEPGAK